MFRIWLFGSLSVAADEVDEEALVIAGRCASLLAYLALGHGRCFSRSELLDNLWPEGAGRSTTGSFNTALWRLRCLIERPPLKHGDLIVSDRRGAIGLTGPVPVWLDVEEFERSISPGLDKPVERLDETDMEGLRRGVALYKTDVLADLTDDWALREREKHRRHYLNALGRLMQVATIRRDYDEGIRHAQAILDNNALREDVHRDLMQLYVFNGQRAQALRQFEQCRDLLRRELAIHPMRETMALYRMIADGAIAASDSGLPTPMPTATPPAPPALARAADASHRLLAADVAEAREVIHVARRQLASVDSQLQLSLQFLQQ